MSCKILASRACELASTDEMTLDLSPRDVEFVDTSKQFLLNLRRIDQVKPFKRAFVPENNTLVGFVISQDGGRPGFGSLIHSLASSGEAPLYRNVALGRSRVAKRTVVS